MIQIYEKQLCCGCHGCVQACPRHCIEMEADNEGFFYPVVDESRCVDCGICEQVCPVLRSEPDNSEKDPMAFAMVNKNEAVRRESSSGGVFSLLAEAVLDHGGIVFGAAWTENFSAVQHIGIRAKEEIAKLQGSKYLQSAIENSYIQAKQCLENGEYVLFSGTPCQIEGLKRYLNKEYSRLLCVDVICHGVPSQDLWRKYLEECENKASSQAETVSFRKKKPSWKKYSLAISFCNGKRTQKVLMNDPYIKAFLKNASLRPSCYDCAFKKKNRQSDLTLADFWGIEQVLPKMDDGRGTSLVLVHSEAGREAIKRISDGMISEPVVFEAAIAENPSLTASVSRHENRDAFLESVSAMGVSEAVQYWITEKVDLKEMLYYQLRKAGIIDAVKKFLGRN